MKTFEKLESLGFFEWLKVKGFGVGFTPMILDNQPINSIERTGYNAIAFRWFREKYGYWSYVKEVTKGTCRFYIEKFDEKFFNSDIIDTLGEAELACLDKLIEIVESKSE